MQVSVLMYRMNSKILKAIEISYKKKENRKKSKNHYNKKKWCNIINF